MNVLKVNNANVRMHLENFSKQYTFPDEIKFVQDGNGDWITSIENLQNIRYKGIRADFKEYLAANGIVVNVNSLKEALERWGDIIVHVPKPDNIQV
jgi:peroxiredoxin